MKISTDSCCKWKKKIIDWTVGKHFPVILEKDVCIVIIKLINV